MAAQLTLLAFQGAGKELLSVALEPPPDGGEGLMYRPDLHAALLAEAARLDRVIERMEATGYCPFTRWDLEDMAKRVRDYAADLRQRAEEPTVRVVIATGGA